MTASLFVRVRVAMAMTALFSAAKYAQGLLHHEEGRETNENTQTVKSICSHNGTRLYEPNENVALLLHHNDMGTFVLMLTHERMGNQVKEHVGKESSGLNEAQCRG